MPRLRRPHPVLDRVIVIVILAIAFLCLAMSARADILPAPRWFTAGAQPMCQALPTECQPYDVAEPFEIKLTDQVFARLNKVNDQVNKQITYQTDTKHYGVPELWSYPADDRGDCEDFALEKRRRLVALGFPRRALLIAIVNVRNSKAGDELHAVLIARTDRGDVILDLKEGYATVRSTLVTPKYDYLWIESQRAAGAYTAVDEDRKPNDTRCYGAARYEAMSEGAAC